MAARRAGKVNLPTFSGNACERPSDASTRLYRETKEGRDAKRRTDRETGRPRDGETAKSTEARRQGTKTSQRPKDTKKRQREPSKADRETHSQTHGRAQKGSDRNWCRLPTTPFLSSSLGLMLKKPSRVNGVPRLRSSLLLRQLHSSPAART